MVLYDISSKYRCLGAVLRLVRRLDLAARAPLVYVCGYEYAVVGGAGVVSSTSLYPALIPRSLARIKSLQSLFGIFFVLGPPTLAAAFVSPRTSSLTGLTARRDPAGHRDVQTVRRYDT